MKNKEQLKNDIISLLKKNNMNIDDFYREIIDLNSYDYFSIEARKTSSRVMDLGPNKPFYFKIEEPNGFQEIIDIYRGIIDLSTTDNAFNILRLLLFASIIEDHTNGKQLQEKFYNIQDQEKVNDTLHKIIESVNSIDWKRDLDIKEDISSINEWNNLFRSFAHLFHHSNIVDILVFVIKKAKELNIKSKQHLAPLLKARILFSISLDDYLSVFQEDDFEFIVGYLFCSHAPHYPNEEKSVDFIKDNIETFSRNEHKFESLINKIFTNYYYQNDEKNDVKKNVVKIIAQKLSDKIKDKTYFPQLNLQDYVIYPRAINIIQELHTQLTNQDVSNHIVNAFNSTLSRKYPFMDNNSLDFPYDPLSNIIQESYAFILHSILNCSDDVFKNFETKLKQCCYLILPHYFGRYYSESFAIRFTTNLYLIVLSVIWLTVDLTDCKKRFDSILKILNDALVESYTYKLVPHLKNDNNRGFSDDIGAFFYMMEQTSKSDKLEVYSLISKPIEKHISLNWPWLPES